MYRTKYNTWTRSEWSVEAIYRQIMSEHIFSLLFDISNVPGLSIVKQKLANVTWQSLYDVAYVLWPTLPLVEMAIERLASTLMCSTLGPTGPAVWTDPAIGSMATLAQYIKYAATLKELNVDLGCRCGNPSRCREYRFDVIGDLCLESLHTVTLLKGTPDLSSFVDFFANHPNLKTVHFGWVVLMSESWMEAMHEICKRPPNIVEIIFSGELIEETRIRKARKKAGTWCHDDGCKACDFPEECHL